MIIIERRRELGRREVIREEVEEEGAEDGELSIKEEEEADDAVEEDEEGGGGECKINKLVFVESGPSVGYKSVDVRPRCCVFLRGCAVSKPWTCTSDTSAEVSLVRNLRGGPPPEYFTCEGEMTCEDGSIYTGGWLNGNKEGKGKMKGYKAQLNVADRWAVVAFVRALQYSRLIGRDELKDIYGKDPDSIPLAE